MSHIAKFMYTFCNYNMQSHIYKNALLKKAMMT